VWVFSEILGVEVGVSDALVLETSLVHSSTNAPAKVINLEIQFTLFSPRLISFANTVGQIYVVP